MSLLSLVHTYGKMTIEATRRTLSELTMEGGDIYAIHN